jgi:hypothetical protein
MNRHPLSRLRWRTNPGYPRASAFVLFSALLLPTVGCQSETEGALELSWTEVRDRPWPGPELWPNRIQDWEVKDGQLRGMGSLPMRTAHVLTHRAAPAGGEIEIRLVAGTSDTSGTTAGIAGSGPGDAPTPAALGILIGAGGESLDYRRTALIHHSSGPGGGIFLGVSLSGNLVASDFSEDNRILASSPESLETTDSLEIRIRLSHSSAGGQGETGSGGAFCLDARELGGQGPVVTLALPDLPLSRLTGGLALVSNPREGGGTETWFRSVRMEGAGIQVHDERKLGPILGAQHILDRDVLTLTAQLLPVSPISETPARASADTVRLELQDAEGAWTLAALAPVVVPGYTATFRLTDWASTRAVPYRLRFWGDGREGSYPAYEGAVRPEPDPEQPFVVAAFTGNHNVASPGVDRGSFPWQRDLWFPHEDIVSHVKAHDPDFLFFSGDQVYEGASPTRADFENPYEDYLYKWYLWLWAFRDLTAETPSVAIPDDHDVFHGNVWGAGGRATPPGLSGAEAQDQGGYKLPADWVNMVQRTQASHLPEPWDRTPADQGIEVYFTDILYGGVSFAVLEDRKFKSPPKLLLPEADVWNGWSQNPDFHAPSQADAPGASLLGERQEAFLDAWAEDWTDGTWMKVVLSQTIFANVATIPADASNGSVIPSLPIPEPGVFVSGDKKAADMDSNGWPQAGRERAVRAMRKGFAVHLAGDQHLASTLQYGLDGFGNGSFALCVPSVANFWPRRWYPPEPGENRNPGDPLYTGDFRDGFGNPMTVFAVSNPASWGREPEDLHNRAPGYGIARFDRSSREVTLEAWPRWADPAGGDEPYPGWPVRFNQLAAYGGPAFGFLPTLVVQGMENPVVQVVTEQGGEVLYTLRISGDRYTPRVFAPGSYTVRVGEPGTEAMRTFLGLGPTADSSRVLEVDLGG